MPRVTHLVEWLLKKAPILRLAFGFFSVLLVGCSSADESGFIPQVLAPGLGESPHIVVGLQSPSSGKEIPVSEGDSNYFRKILSDAEQVRLELPYSEEDQESIHVSPPHDLCYLRLDGQLWYFLPPANPYLFRLPEELRSDFKKRVISIVEAHDRKEERKRGALARFHGKTH